MDLDGETLMLLCIGQLLAVHAHVDIFFEPASAPHTNRVLLLTVEIDEDIRLTKISTRIAAQEFTVRKHLQIRGTFNKLCPAHGSFFISGNQHF